MKNILLAFAFLISISCKGQVKPCQLPQTSTAHQHDWLVIQDSTCSTISVKKIWVLDFLTSLAIGSGGSVPSGAAGGDLSGTYPNPTVKQSSVAFALNGIISVLGIASQQDDWNPTGLSGANTIRVSSTVDIAITGLAGVASGRILSIVNVGSNKILFPTAASSSTGNNQFLFYSDIILLPKQGMILQYDITTHKWRCIAQSVQPGVSVAVDSVYKNSTRDSFIVHTTDSRTYLLKDSVGSGGGGGTTTDTLKAGVFITGANFNGAANVTWNNDTSSTGFSGKYLRRTDSLSTGLATWYYVLTHQDTTYTSQFWKKVRGELSGTSPVTYNNITGAIGVTGLTGTNTGDITIAGENYLSLASQVLTANAVNLSGTNATGTLAAGRFPALTGDVTTSAGSLATTIANDAVTLAKMANMATSSLIYRRTAGTGDPEVNTLAQLKTDLQIIDTTAIEFVIDGGGATITTGLKGYVEVPFNCTIVRATLLADQSGSIVVDVFKSTYAQFDAGATHPVSGDKITASAPPTISSATKSQDATLTGWTTAVASGSILAINVNSITTCERVTLSLKVIR